MKAHRIALIYQYIPMYHWNKELSNFEGVSTSSLCGNSLHISYRYIPKHCISLITKFDKNKETVTMVKSLKSNPTRQAKKDQPKASKKQVKETKALESEDLEAVSESDESDIEGFQSASENEASSDAGSSEEEEEEEEQDEEEGELGEIELKQGSHTIKKLDPKKQSENDKAKAKEDKSSDLSGILYISRLPQGFKERELSKYFSQFGDLKQVRLARNKKTGNSRHYAFLEYINKDDAVVAQESMNNYLLMGHLLKVKVLPNGSSIDKLFRYKKKPFVTSKVTKSSAQLKKTADEKHEERIAKLKDAGIDFKW
ncbi:rRNA-binding ribosome biosynthesis protein NOP15 [Kluyveromyces lactis]|uniref:KLLA0F23650p n=1 Tax=Kluyveromyces lactis (strain ATCC 8585 / CBS 2359 / DSM 70799 / NBRC 1267 / NRRL Y-1140 / WM37) TaxID=284590 RepID=Q6CIV5_KLULA|nr:uncharacterized protein KLLA0_F23650g [Kluyveromyces lactis]CAG98842.1 KLLA0F23650p [Kluyveromyces lactis]|eukprot:XP_456134.1 uncharacterized protein KLLA0_F23650g [Kluyveromyces lactis]